MNIAIDVDETLTAYDNKCKQKLVEAYMQITGKTLKEKDLNGHYVSHMYEWEKDDMLEYWNTIGTASYYIANAKNGAAEITKKLKECGHKIFILTARVDYLHGDAYSVTKTWLDKNNICYDKLITNLDGGKTQAMLDNHIQLMIDDSANVLKECENINVDCILMSSYHNQKVRHMYKCADDWFDVYKFIEKM